MAIMNQQIRLAIIFYYNILLLFISAVVTTSITTASPYKIMNRPITTSSRTTFIVTGRGVLNNAANHSDRTCGRRAQSHLNHSDIRKQTPPPLDSADLDYTLKKRNPYDVHVYYTNQSQQRVEAMALRQLMTDTFPWMNFYNPKDRPIGPHPLPMWEADFGAYDNRNRLGEVYALLKKEHGNLSVLIHPHSIDGDYEDHTRHALWFGEVLELRIGGWRRND